VEAQPVSVSDSPEKDRLLILEGIHKPHILKINIDKMPRAIEIGGRQLSDSADFSFNVSANKLVIRTSGLHQRKLYHI
jgi:hypothetical protein